MKRIFSLGIVLILIVAGMKTAAETLVIKYFEQ